MSDSPAINTAQRVVNRVWLWRLVIFELVITCAITAGMFYQSWMTGDTEWSSLAPGRKMTFEVGITMQVLMVIKAFLSKTMANVSKGINLPASIDGGDGGNTTTLQRRSTQTETLQTHSPGAEK